MADSMEKRLDTRGDGMESPFWAVGLLLALVVLAYISAIICHNEKADLHAWVRILGVIATISIFTILYKENPIFRFAEHIFIGLATGFGIVLTWYTFAEPKWYNPMMPASLVPKTVVHGIEHPAGQGQWWFIFALFLGLLFFTVFIPRLSWMNRFAMSILFGFYAGAALQGFMGLLGPQLVAMFSATPVTTYAPTDMPAGANNIHMHGLGLWWHTWWLLAFVVLVCTLAYFVFSIEHKAAWIRKPAKVGRYCIMITLGAIFGTTVMARFALAIDRLGFLRQSVVEWGHLAAHWLHLLK